MSVKTISGKSCYHCGWSDGYFCCNNNKNHRSPVVFVVLMLTVLTWGTSTSVLPVQAWISQQLPLHNHRHSFRTMNQRRNAIPFLKMSSTSSSSGQQQIAPSPQLPKGSAAVPYPKQNIITLGNGGYLGGILFGYLQRASTIYSTGIGGSSGSGIRSIAATADTSVRLNRILNKHFVLAYAGESYIKLTNLSCVDAIQQRMIGYDAMVFGTNLYLERKKVAANTYERTPNDLAYVCVALVVMIVLQSAQRI